MEEKELKISIARLVDAVFNGKTLNISSKEEREKQMEEIERRWEELLAS